MNPLYIVKLIVVMTIIMFFLQKLKFSSILNEKNVNFSILKILLQENTVEKWNEGIHFNFAVLIKINISEDEYLK